VGLCLQRGPEMIAAVLAVWQAGAAYLPLDPDYPPARLAFMLADSRAAVLVGTSAVIDELPAGRIRAIAVDDPAVAAAVAAMPAAGVAGVAAGQLAYVMYTSGSTGVPKGVQVTHRGLVNYVAWAARAYGIDAGHGAPLHTSLAFDLTLTSVLLPLVAGSAVVISREGGAEGLAAVLREGRRFALVKVVPAHLPLLAGLLPARTLAGAARRLVVGGEALAGAEVRSWLQDAPGCVVVNEYGPTEAVVGCCVFEVAAGQEVAESVPIGAPVANTRLYVLDAHLGPVPAGVVGELFVGGAQLARGYAGRPALTAERFIADRFAGDGSRLYRTGDLARWMAGGQLVFAGRADDQVKIRGFRVEPGEVEAVLAAHPAVAQAVVVAREDTAGDRRLAAYVVAAAGGGAAADGAAGVAGDGGLAGAVRGFAAARLPEYMLPSVVVVLDAVPLTASGKVDRRALPAPDYPAVFSGQGPATYLEEILCGMFAEALELDRVGVEDSFFDLGGHSLLAVSLVERLRARGMQIALGTLFEAPTVAELIKRLDQTSVRDALGVLFPIRAHGSKPPFFCIHPAGGVSWCYMPLARCVPAEYPLYGLQARGFDSTSELASSIQDMVKEYIEQIRAVQGSGPYHLLGWSFGGIAAHEIAVQLQAAGDQVAALIIMDAYPPGQDESLDAISHEKEIAEKREGPTGRADLDASAQQGKLADLTDWVRQQYGGNSEVISDEDLVNLARIIHNSDKILRAHEFRRFEGDLFIIVAADDRHERAPGAEEWKPYVSGKISEFFLPCKHGDMMQPDMLAQAWVGISTWLKLES